MTIRSVLPSVWKENEWPRLFGNLHNEIDRVFQDFSTAGAFPVLRTGGDLNLTPDVNVAETDKALEITAELPGVDLKDVDVKVTDNRIIIRAEKKVEEEDKSKDYHIVERSYGKFQRSMLLPVDVDTDKVEAKFKDGILTVTLPKTTEVAEKSHKVKIKAAA